MNNKLWREKAKACRHRKRHGDRTPQFPGNPLCDYYSGFRRCMQRTCPMVVWWDKGSGKEALRD